ncbi:MAG: aminotransferase class V-fold PLP-dependent enzyme, partial [Candidatus Nanohaloarchaea archaeon]|nr:aminotransferase class V-fold PLP-dependent enzyme [Candidatus Nanohaloarchaea archaeon]
MDAATLREDFPALDRRVNGNPLVYLDNAATAHKPRRVIDAVRDFYEQHNANVHRCVHQLGTEATELYDDAHTAVGNFIGAGWDEVVFTKNTTEALNLVAYAYAMDALSAGDEILLTGMEHHSMIVPMQFAAEKTGAELRYVDVTEEGT